jgi:hypothetical protein
VQNCLLYLSLHLERTCLRWAPQSTNCTINGPQNWPRASSDNNTVLQNEKLNMTPVRLPKTYFTWDYSER